MIEILLLATYLSLVLELVLIPVPSIVSAVQLAGRDTQADRGLRAYRWYIPVLINIATWAWPLVLASRQLWNNEYHSIEGPVSVLGLLLIVAGRLLTISSALYLRRVVDPGLARGSLKPPLTTGGPFRWSRNPGLVGMYLLGLGILLVQPGLLFALGLCFYLWHMHQRVIMEEHYLKAQFGDQFTDYLSAVPRYLGPTYAGK